MRKIILLIFMPLCLGLFIIHPAQSEVYKYTDKDGVESYTDSIQAVPDKYRKKAVEMQGLREKDEAAKTPEYASVEKLEAAQTASMTEAFKIKVRKAAEGFQEKGYWKPVAAVAVFLVVFFIIGKVIKTLGGGPGWNVVKVALVLGGIIGLFYMYSSHLLDMYGSIKEKAVGLTKKAETISDNVKKSTDDNK